MPKAGPDKQLCGGQRYGQPEGVLCEQRAGWGTDHPGIGYCKRHGGSTRNHKRAAALEIARQECVTLGIHVEIDPSEALLREVWESAGNVAFYRQLIQALPTHPDPDVYVTDDEGDGHWERGTTGVYGRTYHVSGVPTGEAKPHVLVVLYNQERDRLRAVCEAAIRANVEERRVQLAEREGQMIADVLKGVLTELGVYDRPEAPAIVRKHLALVAST